MNQCREKIEGSEGAHHSADFFVGAMVKDFQLQEISVTAESYREIVLLTDSDQALSRPLVSIVRTAKYQVPSSRPAIS